MNAATHPDMQGGEEIFEALADAWLDGAATPDQEAQLASWIARSPAAARAFMARSRLDADLEAAVRELGGQGAPADSRAIPRPAFPSVKKTKLGSARLSPWFAGPWTIWQRRRLHHEPIQVASGAENRRTLGRLRRYGATVAAVVFLCAGLLTLMSWRGSRQDCPMAANQGPVVWDGDQPPSARPLAPGSTWSLRRGQVRLVWPSGALATITGPALFKVAESVAGSVPGAPSAGTPGALSLQRGQLWARCEGPAKGFAVITPDGVFRDLGTEFTLTCETGAPTVLTVLSGRVEARSEAAGASAVDVSQGQTVAVLANREIPMPHATQALQGILDDRSMWFYFDGDRSVPADWHMRPFSEAEWKVGAGPFGYELGSKPGLALFATALEHGDASGRVFPVKWFRTHFRVNSPEKIKALHATVDFNGGMALYLNGHEIHRCNLPMTTPLPPLAHAASNQDWHLNLELPVDALVAGDNVLAASIHQPSALTRGMHFGPVKMDAVPVEAN